MINENATRHTLSVLVDNASGVLSQVSRLFSRKGYNIESLAVGATDNPEVSRITIEVLADDMQITQIMNQLGKMFVVHSIKLLAPEHSIPESWCSSRYGQKPVKCAMRSFRSQTSSGHLSLTSLWPLSP